MKKPPDKISYENLAASMRVFLDFPEVEDSIAADVRDTVQKIMLSKAQNGGRPPADVLTDYFNAGADAETRMKIVIEFAGGSLEKIKRVYKALFPGEPWGKIKSDEKIRRRMAEFLIHPRREQKQIPRFVCESFALPPGWIKLLQDEEYLRPVARGILQSKYAVRMGEALEERIRGEASRCGETWEKGASAIVDDKEVDVAVPSLAEPRVLIMSSYQLTTSSGQTSKANEQAKMYSDVRTHNGRRRQSGRPDVLFVNVIDGGGWLARPRDLRQIYDHCDYCFSHATLDGLREVLACRAAD